MFVPVPGQATTSSGRPRASASILHADLDSFYASVTVGIARTKFLAKVASQEAKPDGLLLVPPDRELAFLHPLPVRRLWGVGAKTAEKLHVHGIDTVADVAELGESTLASLVGGAMGRQLFALSHNIDRRRVVTGVRRRSVGAQRALGRVGNTMSPSQVDALVVNLVDRITRRMRKAERTGRTVVLRLRFDDFGRATRSCTLAKATASTDVILSVARNLVTAATPLIAERGLTLLGFAVSNIDRDGAQQLELACPPEVDPTALGRGSGAHPVRDRSGAAWCAAGPQSRSGDADAAGLNARPTIRGWPNSRCPVS